MNLFFLQPIFYCLYILYSFSTLLLLLLCFMMHMRNADSVYVKVLDGIVLNKLLRVRDGHRRVVSLNSVWKYHDKQKQEFEIASLQFNEKSSTSVARRKYNLNIIYYIYFITLLKVLVNLERGSQITFHSSIEISIFH